jgi:predicted RNase H-like nuclease
MMGLNKIAFVGFDSAWVGNPKVPGAICAISFDGKRFHDFKEPKLVGFDDARRFIARANRKHRLTLIAIDQPTIVPNDEGMRPVEKVAASIVSWLGGGVQPAYRKKENMFGDGAPIWKFLRRLGATENPELSRRAVRGKFIMEVFPALALPSLNRTFCGWKKGPRYNPANRGRFRQKAWQKVVATVLREARKLKCEKFIRWCNQLGKVRTPRKCHQDKLDAAICLLIMIRWRRGKRKDSAMIGDLKHGYIVAPVIAEIRDRLRKAAFDRRVALDGAVPLSQ